jgi:hypothetical protein
MGVAVSEVLGRILLKVIVPAQHKPIMIKIAATMIMSLPCLPVFQ